MSKNESKIRRKCTEVYVCTTKFKRKFDLTWSGEYEGIKAKEQWNDQQIENIYWEGLHRSNKGRSFGVRLTRAKISFE